MKKLLATTAIAMIAMASAASAQSVLERVLSKIDNSTNLASVNGTFANIAENIGGLTAVNTYGTAPAVATVGGGGATTATTLGAASTQAEYDAWVARNTVVAVYDSAGTDLVYYDAFTGSVIRAAQYDQLGTAAKAAYTVVSTTNTLLANGDGTFSVVVTADKAAQLTSRDATLAGAPTPDVAYTGAVAGVDGSINNAIQGVTAAVADATQSASAGSTVAYQFDLPTYDLGELSTTALGAVNTGTITLGVNSTVDDAKTSSTQAVSSVMAQLGGSANTGAIVLNVASNMTGVNGSINNTMNDVNGAMLKASTTALGAVNTGIITSGVNAAVQGIVGTSGQTNGVAP